MTSDLLSSTTWFKGPAFLHDVSSHSPELQETHDLIDSDADSEVRPQVVARFTHVIRDVIHPQRFERFSKLSTLLTALARLIHVARSFAHSTQDKRQGWHVCRPTEEELLRAKVCIVKSVQIECYSEELKCINSGSNIPPSSSLWKLMHRNQLLRVGGQIERLDLSMNEVHPVIPGRHHLATLLVSKCRRLRGKAEHQQMAALPAERLQVAPPFTYVGVDIFGPWEIVSRRTKGGVSNSKRWAAMFSCMCSRAVHIEVIEAISTSSFINALRRFFAIMGPAKQIRSDCGTNFIGASCKLDMDQSNPGFKRVEEYLDTQSGTWVFNPPHASHMGGAWERMIGIAHLILNCMLLEQRKSHLSHEVLTTFMA